MTEIKHLTASAPALLMELLNVFGEAFGDQETYTGKVPSDAYVRSLLQNDTFIALAALRDSKVVGGLTAYVLEKPEQERKEIYIYDVAVLEASRREGIATDLIGHLKEIAKDIGAYAVYVQADRGDEPAIRLYEFLGKKEDVLHFDIELD